LVARFTLDSATEFLFNNDVHSLDASLPYPPNSPSSGKNSSAFTDHPSDVFVKAFVGAQENSAKRTLAGSIWPMLEFLEDAVAIDRKILNRFAQPFLEKSLREKKSRSVDSEDVTETLLDYLMDKTSGEYQR